MPPGMVLAMGDHRGNSNDGRKFGFINERELFGRAVAIYYRSGDCRWMRSRLRGAAVATASLAAAVSLSSTSASRFRSRP